MTVAESPHVALPTHPSGWFAVAVSHELKRGGHQEGILCAAPYRIERSATGALRTEGAALELREQNGLILAWHHPAGKRPTWEVPELDENGFRPFIRKRLDAKSHPQETFENSIDTGHFAKVHGYTDISILEPMTLEGHTAWVRYEIARAFPLPLVSAKIRPNFEVRLHGLGMAHNHIYVPPLGLRLRMLACSTPTEPGQVVIRLAISVAKESRLPLGRFLMPFVHRIMAHTVVKDFRQDMRIWESKRYLERPVLAATDGPIGKFRRWSKQFYL